MDAPPETVDRDSSGAGTSQRVPGPVVVRVARLDGAGRGHVRLLCDPDASRGPAVLFIVGDTPTDWPALTYVTGDRACTTEAT
jgi:hypothetical protein